MSASPIHFPASSPHFMCPNGVPRTIRLRMPTTAPHFRPHPGITLLDSIRMQLKDDIMVVEQHHYGYNVSVVSMATPLAAREAEGRGVFWSESGTGWEQALHSTLSKDGLNNWLDRRGWMDRFTHVMRASLTWLWWEENLAATWCEHVGAAAWMRGLRGLYFRLLVTKPHHRFASTVMINHYELTEVFRTLWPLTTYHT